MARDACRQRRKRRPVDAVPRLGNAKEHADASVPLALRLPVLVQQGLELSVIHTLTLPKSRPASHAPAEVRAACSVPLDLSSQLLAARRRAPLIALVVASAVCFAFLLFLARDLTFFADDWSYIDQRQDWSISSFMAPYNGHWSLMVALAWKPLLELVGLRSFMPYIALTLLAHVAVCIGLYRICAYLAGAWIGLAAALLLLFAGYAGEVFWQANVVNHVAATACGVWAIDLFLRHADRRRLTLAAVLLTFGVATAESALFFVAAIGAACLLYPSRRRDIWIVAPAIAAYALWLLLFGSASLASTHGITVTGIVEYILVGIAATIGANIGMSSGLAKSLGVSGVVVAAVAGLATVFVGLAAAIDIARRRTVPIAV